MRLGVSTYAFARTISAGGLDVDRLLRWAGEHEVDAVQFCENLPWPADRPLPEGLIVETGCRGIGDHLLEHLRLAERTGSGFVRLVLDDGADEPSPEEAIRRLRPYADAYRAAGVVLAIENHDRFPARVLRGIVEALELGVVLDTANSLGSLEDLNTVVAELGPFVVNLHAKEIRAVRKRDLLGFDVEGAPLGEGGFDWLETLAKLPRLRSVTLEQWLSFEREEEGASLGVRRLRTLIETDHDRLVLGQPRPPEPTVLTTSTLVMELEPHSGWLRNVRRNGREIVRAVYGAARTADWGTPQPAIRELTVDQRADGFRVSYAASVEPALPFRWRVEIAGDGDEITFHIEGEATDEMEANRVGLCLLHPPSTAGQPCRITHPDGTETRAEFPREVAPHQPFREVRVLETAALRVEFEGETFETEDQRNWTDASFKTYSRPLAWSRPYRLAKGERVRQAVRLKSSFEEGDASPFVPPETVPLPSIGIVGDAFPLGVAIEHVAIPDGETMRLVDREGRTLWRPDVFAAANFTELNRERPARRGDVMFAMNPQVHAFDWRSICEATEAQFDCVWTARGFARRVHVGPLSLDPEDEDPRADSLLAAGWVLASLAALSDAGAASVTLSRQLAEGPARHVLADLHEFAGGMASGIATSEGAFVELRREGQTTFLFANLTDKVGEDLMAPRGRMRILDATNVRLAILEPDAWRAGWVPFDEEWLTLPPFAYVRVDAETDS